MKGFMRPEGLLSLEAYAASDYIDLFQATSEFKPSSPGAKKRGLLAFFEKSTRTRISFESAGLSAGVEWLEFDPEVSSLSKGESLQDSFEVLSHYEIDFFVVRHSEDDLPKRVSQWTSKPVLSAGAGTTSHPTQALGDAYTLYQEDSQRKWRIVFYGDAIKSRVFRSAVQAFQALGWELALTEDGSSETEKLSKDFRLPLVSQNQISQFDVCYALRTQKERGGSSPLGPLRSEHLSESQRLMHAGPVVWGEDVSETLRSDGRSLVLKQVRAAYEVRRELLRQLQLSF